MDLNKHRLNEKQLLQLNDLLDELSDEQMIWLSGYLEGRLASGSTENKSLNPEPVQLVQSIAKLTILYATETGNGQVLAEKMAEKAAFKNIDTNVYNLYEYEFEQLAREDNVALIISTHGEGEIPEMGEDFYSYIS
ncbi:MAG: flavodoxin domain-containing protein, partial [Draconibacterium sp.]|nr:flavodoxin domain-containing protein [Draconibacterium sp.]